MSCDYGFQLCGFIAFALYNISTTTHSIFPLYKNSSRRLLYKSKFKRVSAARTKSARGQLAAVHKDRPTLITEVKKICNLQYSNILKHYSFQLHRQPWQERLQTASKKQVSVNRRHLKIIDFALSSGASQICG